jgi:hypothetical protein
MTNNNLKWVCSPSEDEEIWDASEFFDTKEEAIEVGKKALREFIADPENEYDQSDVLGHVYEEYEGIHTIFAVGQLRSPSLRIYADNVIESLQEQSDERCGEVSETYLNDVTKEQEKDLEEKLNAVLNEWLTKYNHQPTFYYLDNVEKVRLEEAANE